MKLHNSENGKMFTAIRFFATAFCISGLLLFVLVNNDHASKNSVVANAESESNSWTGIIKPKKEFILADAQSEANTWKDKV